MHLFRKPSYQVLTVLINKKLVLIIIQAVANKKKFDQAIHLLHYVWRYV